MRQQQVRAFESVERIGLMHIYTLQFGGRIALRMDKSIDLLLQNEAYAISPADHGRDARRMERLVAIYLYHFWSLVVSMVRGVGARRSKTVRNGARPFR